jgi:hypothetical protein
MTMTPQVSQDLNTKTRSTRMIFSSLPATVNTAKNTSAFSFLSTPQGSNLTHLAYHPLWVVLDFELIIQTTYS